ncbi:MAG: TolC family protein, partial [Amylibacter sp.]
MKLATILKATTLGVSIFVASPVFATTLTDALIQAYQTNPSLRVGRSSLRATDEGVRQAKAALEPTVSANISVDRNETQNPSIDTTPSTNAEIIATLSLFAGGTVLNGIEQARYNVLGVRQSLKSTEQRILLDAVTAFMDVRRDQKNVQLAKNSVKVLNEEVRAASERFEVGEVTRTDVAQAESRLAASESELEISRAALNRSIDFYIATVGSQPKDLRTPPPAPKLPPSANAAEAIAVARHPAILQQQFVVKAAEKAVAIAKGNKAPVISVNVLAGRSNNNSTILGGPDKQSHGRIGLDIDQTIYQGGRLNSVQR